MAQSIIAWMQDDKVLTNIPVFDFAKLNQSDQEQYIQKVANNNPHYCIMDANKMPDRRFRSAWTIKDNQVGIDETKKKEVMRQELQKQRDAKLQAIVYDFLDGRIIQARPQDINNITLAIQRDYTGDWVMADNSVATISADELQRAFEAGIQQGEAIWQDYINTIKNITQ